ncbi:MAG: hypothetical protein V3S92_02250 [Alphaproteobacteria bacterium]
MVDPRIKQALQALVGLFAALITAGLILSVIFSLGHLVDGQEAPFAEDWGLALIFAYFGVMSALPVVLVGASILYIAFRRFGWFMPWQSAAGGAVLGALVFPVRTTLSSGWRGLFSLETLAFGLLGAVVGAVGGLVFWWIAARPLDPTDRRDGLPEIASPRSEN